MTAAERPSEGVPTVAFVTLGCPKNEVDSDRMAAKVASSAYGVTESMEHADVVVLNTCAFIEAAAQESVDTALQIAADWKARAKGRYLVVAGCLASRYGEDLAEAMPEADAFVPVAEENAVLRVIEQLTGVPASESVSGAADRTTGAASAYIQVSDGCHRACTYCTIPSIRGPYRSRRPEDLTSEAVLLVAGGARELVLVGQDTSAYGRDLPEPRPRIEHVLRGIARIDGLAWLRLMYVQPDGVTDELLTTIAEEPTICRYLDMPIQHASRDVLRAMARTGDAESLLGLIARIRTALPDVVLRTTLIAGFPGETERDVEELERFLSEARFDYAGVFAYSPEEGTVAATLPGLLPERERLARARQVSELAERIGFERAAARVGTVVEVLAEGADEDGTPVGRWRGQAPDVDGVVTFDAPVSRGGIVSVLVTEALGYDLVGEVQA